MADKGSTMNQIVVYMDNSEEDLSSPTSHNRGHNVMSRKNIRAVGFRGRCQRPKGSARLVKQRLPLSRSEGTYSNTSVISVPDDSTGVISVPDDSTGVISVPDDSEMTVDEDSFEIRDSAEMEIDRQVDFVTFTNNENQTFRDVDAEPFKDAKAEIFKDAEAEFWDISDEEIFKMGNTESVEPFEDTFESKENEFLNSDVLQKSSTIIEDTFEGRESEFRNSDVLQKSDTIIEDTFEGRESEFQNADILHDSGTVFVEDREKPKLQRCDSGISLPESQGTLDSSDRMARSLCWLLRHGAEQCGLQFSTGGYLYVKDIIALPRFQRFDEEDIKSVISSDKKKRFSLERGGGRSSLKIKANYGHSLSIDSSRSRRSSQSSRSDRQRPSQSSRSDRRRRHTSWDPMERLSRSMARILRHTAKRSGLSLMTGGYVYVDDLLDLWEMNIYHFEDVKYIVDHDVKGRFQLAPDETNLSWKVRATGKHTLKFVKEENPQKSADLSLKTDNPQEDDKKDRKLKKSESINDSKIKKSHDVKESTQDADPKIKKISNKDQAIKEGQPKFKVPKNDMSGSDWSLDLINTNVQPDEKKISPEILPSQMNTSTKKTRLAKKMPKVPLKALSKMAEKTGEKKKKKVLVRMKTSFKRRGSLDELRDRRYSLKRNLKK